MRIGTVSININTINHNYGAVLHSWAFQQVLINKIDGVEYTEVIDYLPNYMKGMNRKYPVLGYYKKGLKDAILWSIYTPSNIIKYDKVEKFIKKNFDKTAVKYTEDKLSKETLNYDVLICESDVIWDPNHYDSGFEKTFFFAHNNMKDKKKIAYAASLGNAEFSDHHKKEYRQLLKNMDYISVREKYAVEFTQQFTNKPVEYVLDPTLLLEAKDYEKIIAENKIKNNYLLIYFPLGYDTKLINQAREYAKKNNLEVIELSRYVWNKFRHKVYDTAGIEEFLALIKNAEVIFTNSFHGVCFSIIFEKEFYAFSRKTGRKIENICETFGLQGRFIKKNEFNECEAIDYKKVNEVLNTKRVQSIQYLVRALEEQKTN